MIAFAVVARDSARRTGLLVICLLAAGCAAVPSVRLRSQPHNPVIQRLKPGGRGDAKASSRTRQFLRRHDLKEKPGHNPRRLLNAVAQIHRESPGRESAYALAELSYIAANKLELMHQREAMEMYFNCVAHSYAFLFDPRYGGEHNRYDPRFRNACNLYNSSLESCLRIARRRGKLKPGEVFEFTVAERRLRVAVESRGGNWRPEDFESFEFVSDYELKGLSNHYRTYGLGVPLIAVRDPQSAPPRIERFYAPGLSFPMTAFLRPEWDEADADGTTTLTLELHDPLESTSVNVAGRQVPLESDISTPLAYFLDRPEFRLLDTVGLLRPGMVERVAGLYMIQPYQPGKIPVVMVHGLWSSPMTWIEAINDLQSDPRIRDNYQFWFYLYPTGEPFSMAAVRLRKDLEQVDDVFVAADGGAALRNKVLVGHSMGGLLSRLMTLESGDEFWNGVSRTPLADINAPPKAKQTLSQVYYFEPNRTVGRVVTIASPFRGSSFANGITRWLAKQWITLPRRTVGATMKLLARNPNLEHIAGLTSIDSLAPDSPFLRAMQRVEPPADVPHHNIVGAIRDVPLEENTDGVVSYASAHRADAVSEIVVNAPHVSIQRHPRTVQAIRDVLLEHLDEYNRGGATGIVPLGGRSRNSLTGNGHPPREEAGFSAPTPRGSFAPPHHRGWTPTRTSPQAGAAR